MESKNMRGIFIVLMIALGTSAIAQTPPKQTPASDTLVSTAKEMAAEKSSFNTALNQARTTMDASQKQLSDSLNAKTKDLMEKLKADKKYAPMLAEIDTIQKQVTDLSNSSQNKFQQQTMPMQQKIATDNAVISGLVPIVRKENSWPDTMTFDPETQTWKDSAAKLDKK